MENLYHSLKNIGLSDEYIEFIRKNIKDSWIADGIVYEIEKNNISDINGFMEFLMRNFKLVPEYRNIVSDNPSLHFSKNLILNGINAYTKIVNDAADAVCEIISDKKNISGNIQHIKADTADDAADEADAENNQPEIQKNLSDSKVADEADSICKNQPEIKKPLSDSEVTQHTASLWKYQPVNDDEPENNPDYDVRSLKLPYAEIIGASVRGKKHKHDGSNRDDSFEFDNAGDIVFMAVSDGAGSKRFSRIGAKVSCTEAVASAKKSVEKLKADGIYDELIRNISAPIDSADFMKGCGAFADIIQTSVISARNAVENAFNERKTKYSYLDLIKRDMSLKDFSSTLLMVIAVPVKISNDNQTFVISCQIGDGMVAAVNRRACYADAVKLLGEADSGAFAGETDFLTSESMQHKEKLMGRTKIARREISDILIMTDGVADDYYPNSSQLGRLYTDLRLNGIIMNIQPDDVKSENDADMLALVPQPVSYPWVNDNSIEIPVNYSSAVEKSCGISAEDLWHMDNIISEAFHKLGRDDNSCVENLKIWLDNYVERGSFDDRTLLIYSSSENGVV